MQEALAKVKRLKWKSSDDLLILQGGMDKINKDKQAYITEIEELKTKNRALLNRLIDIDEQK